MNYQRDILNTIREPAFFLDHDFRYVYVNEAYSSYYECSPEDITGKTIAEFLGDEFFIKNVKPHFEKCLCGEHVHYEDMVSFKGKKGERFMEIDYYPHYNDDNIIDGVISISRDKTDLFELNENWINAMNAIDDIVCLIDKDFNIIDINQHGLGFTGKDKEEVIGKKCYQVLHGEDKPESYCPLDTCLKTKKTAQAEIYDEKHNKYFSVKTSPIFSKDGELQRFIDVMHDITSVKEKEFALQELNEEYLSVNEELTEQNASVLSLNEQLEHSEAKYKAAFHTSPDSVNINKMDGEYVEINEGFTQLTGFTEKDVIGKLSSEIDIWSIPEDRERLVAGLKKDGVVENLESVFRAKDGTLIPALMSAKVLQIDNEPHILSVTRAIVERKKMEEDLREAMEKAEEANRLKTEFLNNMSHEVRTPMNGIVGFIELLNKPDISDEKRRNYIRIVKNSSNQLMKIIDDILEISSLETKQKDVTDEEFSLNGLLMELFSIFSLKAKEQNVPIYLKKGLKDSDSHIICDKSKVHKILSNLIENALKFTVSGFVEIGYYIEHQSLVIYVKDTGVGIAPKNHEVIFERFSQAEKEISRKKGGLGLGLSISKENAHLLGGDLTVESEKGKGATFYLTIPYKPKVAERKSHEEQKDNGSKVGLENGHVILVAEDEEVNYLYVEVLVEDEPDFEMSLLHAKNGEEAVKMALEHEVDLVLMDIKMPVMNGHEATKKIKKQKPNLTIIAQTAYSTESDRLRALDSGCDDFISKPWGKDELFGLLKKYLQA